MLDKMWEAYGKSWSQPDEDRNAALAQLVSDEVTYTDPRADIAGRDTFSAHMAQFQQDMGGAYFEIIDVKGHHSKSLARWRLCGEDGNEMMQGTSFATLDGDNKFTSFVGFM